MGLLRRASIGCVVRAGSAVPLFVQDFRRLQVWARAHWLAINVRRATRSFPRSGYASLKSQIVSAAESVPFNIVEGCGAHTRKDFAKFLDVSIKSSTELEYGLQLARDNGVLSLERWQALSAEVVEIRKMLCAFRRRVLDGGV